MDYAKNEARSVYLHCLLIRSRGNLVELFVWVCIKPTNTKQTDFNVWPFHQTFRLRVTFLEIPTNPLLKFVMKYDSNYSQVSVM